MLFLRLSPSTAFQTLLQIMRATPFLQKDSLFYHLQIFSPIQEVVFLCFQFMPSYEKVVKLNFSPYCLFLLLFLMP